MYLCPFIYVRICLLFSVIFLVLIFIFLYIFIHPFICLLIWFICRKFAVRKEPTSLFCHFHLALTLSAKITILLRFLIFLLLVLLRVDSCPFRGSDGRGKTTPLLNDALIYSDCFVQVLACLSG